MEMDRDKLNEKMGRQTVDERKKTKI